MSYRKDKWKSPKRLLTITFGEPTDLSKRISKAHRANPPKEDEDASFTNAGVIAACKELIYNREGDRPVFHAIMYGLDSDTGYISVSHALDILVHSETDESESEDVILNTLAMATVLEIPVFPNSPDLEPELARLHRKMLVEGFTAPNEKGDRIRLMIKNSPRQSIDEADYLETMKPWEPLQPSAISLVKAAVSAELQKLRGTARVLGQLKYAIAGLESLLSNKSRNENAIQSWLTDNPILFGPDYTSVIPKHMLGAEYEMDYALVRHSGIVDLVEIEASNLPLFNRKEDPTSYLIHAEQQVLDWLEWVETNGSYARQNLPGIYSPRALIIIGRASALTPSTIKKLKRRNLTFRGQVEILTYDDLLQRAKNILIFLSANESCA